MKSNFELFDFELDGDDMIVILGPQDGGAELGRIGPRTPDEFLTTYLTNQAVSNGAVKCRSTQIW